MSKKKNQSVPVKKTTPKKEVVNQNYNWIWLSGILVLTSIVFFPSLHNALTNWDDPSYLIENPLIRNLSGANIRRIFSEVYFGNYQPLHIFSYAIEYHFYKLNPTGYHTTSVIIHLLVTGLVYRFCLSLSGNSKVSLIAALLFGIHPMHVESVAWAAERKDLLYAFFFLASLILYIKYIKNGEKIKHLFFALILFTLSIMSKAMASSLPPVLILLDIYFTRKWNWKLVWEKIPFFSISILFGYISLHTVSTTGQTSLHVFTLFERILISNFNLLAYVVKLIIPINLSCFYPYPSRVDGHLPYYFFIAPFIVVGVLLLVIRSIKKTKVIVFGAGFFVACIFLVLQLLPVGPTIISERYTYIPSVGFFFVIAYYFVKLSYEKISLRPVLYIVLAAYSLFLCTSTYQRCKIWKDSITLWSDVLEQFPHVGAALNNRGNIYGKEMGDLDRALEEFNKSILYEPAYPNAYVNRGIVYCMRGKVELAIPDFNKALELKPNDFDATFNRGIAFLQTGSFDKALVDFNNLIALKPEDSRIYVGRGRAYSGSLKSDLALADINHAIELDGSNGEAYFNRGIIQYNLRKYNEAYNDMKTSSELGFQGAFSYIDTMKKAAESSSK